MTYLRPGRSLPTLAVVGFICCLLCPNGAVLAASLPGGPSSGPPQGSLSPLVASPSVKEELSPEPSKQGSNKEGNEGAAIVIPPELKGTASEVGDMMKDPYHNITVSNSDRDEEPIVDSETDKIDDPHVTHDNRTHEEEQKPEKPVDGSTTNPENSTELKLVTSTTSPSDASTELVLDSSTVLTKENITSETVSLSTSSGDSVESSSAESSPLPVVTEDGDVRPPEGASVTSTPIDTVSTGKNQEIVSDDDATSPPMSALISQHDTHDHPAINKASSLNHTTQAAAILAGVVILVALAGYVGLLSWRRMLEKRYGNREMLVNEEDDFRHFEL